MYYASNSGADLYCFPAFIRYKQAAFCYEELILSQPTNPLYHLAYADVSDFFPFLYFLNSNYT